MELPTSDLQAVHFTTRECHSQVEWDTWMSLQGASFLQSWQWGDILQSEGKRVKRLQFFYGKEVGMQAQIVYQNLPFGWKYAFCPKGPAYVKNQEYRILDLEYREILTFIKEKGCLWARIEPDAIPDTKFQIQSSIDTNPRATTLLDLHKTEAELLGAMHEKTRYNIRLAERKGLRIETGKNFDAFWRLMVETGKRDSFKLHGKVHYEKILSSPFSRQLTVYVHDVPLATGVFVGFGKTYTYLYGASEYSHRNLMAPYLVQWSAIKQAKKEGFESYDFFGIAPKCGSGTDYGYDKDHQYGGVTRFKLGFGGTIHEDPGTYDVILSDTKYRVYKAVRKLRRLI